MDFGAFSGRAHRNYDNVIEVGLPKWPRLDFDEFCVASALIGSLACYFIIGSHWHLSGEPTTRDFRGARPRWIKAIAPAATPYGSTRAGHVKKAHRDLSAACVLLPIPPGT